jgi:hypothetical protein
MKLWRLVLDAGREKTWTFLVAATEPFVAVELARASMPEGSGGAPSLEELEALYDPPPTRAGVVRTWRGLEDLPLRATRPNRTMAATRRRAPPPAKPVRPSRRKTG